MQARICFLLKCPNLLCCSTNANDKLLNACPHNGVLSDQLKFSQYYTDLGRGGLFHCFQGALW